MSKRKSGHEKLREKNIKLLREDAKTTKNLLSMFSKLNSNILQDHADAEPIDEVQSHVAKETQTNLDDENGVHTDTNEMTQPILILNITASSSMVEPTGDNEKTTTRVNDWFNKPHLNELTTFYKYHPHQPKTRHFNSKMVYYRPEDGIQRMLLSFSEEKECLFCSVCLADGNEKQKPSSFVTGFNSWTHIHQRIVEHESSKRHQECVEAYLHFYINRTILDMVQGQQYSLRKQLVLHRRLIVARVVSIVKVIGKRGMPYRGKAGCKAVNVLANNKVDHGTFLEIVILCVKYDEILKAHLKEIIDKGMLNDKQDKRNRANRNTFISKSTVNQIILGIAKLMKSAIAEEVKQAGIFSVQLDTTQDVTQADKCAIVLRYVTDKVEERLVGVANSHSGKGSDCAN
ncbi:uncharacterized protein LOC136074593 [Hydra vulgaris]|uniref:Uncharacterized protein LOC136074593 n=1 Tax=Hydra vulgaris TaxID=6087 RepID=A0ABM4B2G2_HYDVU